MRRQILAFALLLASATSGLAAGLPESLIGRWQGAVTAERPAGASDGSQIHLDLAADAEGFSVERDLGPALEKGRAMRISFEPADHPGVFAAAEDGMFSLFGKGGGGNPLQDGRLTWARIDGDRLVLYGFMVAADGSYRLDRLECRPRGNGIEVAFSRRGTNLAEIEVTAILARVGGAP